MRAFPRVIYISDVACGWCFGMKEHMRAFYAHYKGRFPFEIISGNMVLKDEPLRIADFGDFIRENHPKLEEITGAKLGHGYLSLVDEKAPSDMVIHSETAGIALAVVKHKFSDKVYEAAATMQELYFVEGKHPNRLAFYLELEVRLNLPLGSVAHELESELFVDLAKQDFAWVKQLNVTRFPCVLVQTDPGKMFMIARGFTEWEDLKNRMENVIFDVR